FKLYEVKIYYDDRKPYLGNIICILKVFSCDDWSLYNSCKVVEIEITYTNNIFNTIRFQYSTCRVDSISEMKPINQELFESFRRTAEIELQNSLNIFL
ncbi:MAG: hypothetical protein AABY22_27530, partial [Nanoarchaeota archaeon]